MIDIQVFQDVGPAVVNTNYLQVYGATTSHITLSGNQVFDGITGLTGRRILVKHQNDPSQNGIYDANTNGAWTLATDSPKTDGVVIRSLVGVIGTGKYWVSQGSSYPQTTQSSRGTATVVTNWNMKNSASYTAAYYPTNETVGAALIRPTAAGEQNVSFPVYTYFRLSGTWSSIKNLRFRVTAVGGPEASDAQLFFKTTNIYQTPTKTFDGSMILLADANGRVYSDPIYPMLSTAGPNSAVSRQTVYTGNTTLYTNYFVTQMRVNKGSSVGNTAEMELKFEAQEYGDF